MATNNADNFTNPISISTGGTGASTFDTNAPVYYNGSVFADPGAGTAGQMLTSNGSGNPPSWSSGPGPALILISSQTTTSGQTSVNFTSGITTAYNTYYVIFTYVGASAQAWVALNYSTNSGSSYVATGYTNTLCRFLYNSATVNSPSIFTTGCQLSINSVQTPTTEFISGWFYIFNVTNGLGTTSVGSSSGGTPASPNNPNQNSSILACNFGNNGTAINALSFTVGGPGSGVTMPAGAIFSLFGVVE
jgi:hypothetical protein